MLFTLLFTLLAYLNLTHLGSVTYCFNAGGLTLLAYLNYTPRLRYTHEDQIHYSRTRSVARVPSRMPTAQADGVEIGQSSSLCMRACK